MENLIKEIIISAQGLDNRGMHKESKALDDIASSLIMIKEAQYDGTQGYFVRNTRCWNGCFREKRAKGMTSNEAWESCHSEWLDTAMGNGSEKWDKYAGDESPIKVASVNDFISISADEALNNVINDRVDSGISIEHAVPMSLAERSIAIASKLSGVADELQKIASETSVSGTSETLSSIAEEISNIAAEEYVKSISY
jgi:hypothetical protein